MAYPKALILRFVDFADPTIPLHQEILVRDGQVWWGWWRKSHEDQRLDVLEAIKLRLPAEIGLINRRSGEYYRAWCVDMALANLDEKIPSPDRNATPDYYDDEECPAWFLLQEIEEVDAAEWNNRFDDFGEPKGDDSLYWIEEEQGAVLGGGSDVPCYEAGAPGGTILHISDLHFGADHRYPLDGGIEHPSMREIIRDGVREADCQVGVMIVSGDLTTQSNLHALQETARLEIKGLAEELDLPLENVIVVPGNHDIKLTDADPENWAHERGFHTFLEQLFGEERKPEGVFTFELPDGRTLNVAALNSVRFSREETNDYGYVGVRSRYIFDTLAERNEGRDSEELARRGILNFTVLHHHLVSGALTTDPPKKRPVSVTLDAGRIVAEAQGAAVHAAIHGHEHIPFVGAAARQEPLERQGWDGYKRPLAVIGGGSSGVKQNRLSELMEDNTYGLYSPADGGLDIAMYRFNKTVKPHRFLATRFEFAQ